MNLLAYLKAFAISAAVFTPLIIGAYFYGRSDGAAAVLAEQAKTAERIHANDADLRADVEAQNRGSAIDAAQTEVENDAVQEFLEVPEPGDSGAFAGDEWVRNLGRLR